MWYNPLCGSNGKEANTKRGTTQSGSDEVGTVEKCVKDVC